MATKANGGDISIDKVIAEFRDKLVDPLFEDIRRTLEVTCGKSGKDNHGSNFIGNAVVLSGIETVAQFIDPSSEEKRQDFEKRTEELYSKLDPETKCHVTRKWSPREGGRLAKSFMKRYFDDYISKRREFEVPLHELIWEFRNPHVHGFYPFYQKECVTSKGTVVVVGKVGWLYKEPKDKRIGITINEVEKDFDAQKRKLYEKGVDWFGVRPQVLFVFFKQAVEKFIARVCSDAGTRKRFYDNYKRLAGNYGFEDLT